MESKSMKKKQIGGLIIAAILFVAIGVASVLTNALTDSFSQRMGLSNYESFSINSTF